MKESLFIHLLIDDDKETILNKAISDIHSISCSNSSIYLVKPDSFNQVPGSPFAYWVSNKVREFFTTLPPLESDGRFVKVGVSTGDDFRFVRLWWEVSSGELLTGATETLPKEFRQNLLLGQRWVPFAKGGEYSPYYADTHLVIDWFDEGRPIESFFAGARIKKPFFFKYGLTFPYKSQKGFSVWQLPSGSICSHTGQLILVNDKNDIFIILALVNSTAFRGLLNLITAFGRREAGYVGSIPVPKLSPILGKLAEQCLHYKRSLDVTNENSHVFYLPALLLIHGNNLYVKLNNWLAKNIGITKHLLDI